MNKWSQSIQNLDDDLQHISEFLTCPKHVKNVTKLGMVVMSTAYNYYPLMDFEHVLSSQKIFCSSRKALGL